MEYFCKIKRNNHYARLVFGYSPYALLPLFNLKPERVFEVPSKGYCIEFLREDKYSPMLITIWPPKLTEEQFRTINEKWNYCVNNDLDCLEFEL